MPKNLVFQQQLTVPITTLRAGELVLITGGDPEETVIAGLFRAKVEIDCAAEIATSPESAPAGTDLQEQDRFVEALIAAGKLEPVEIPQWHLGPMGAVHPDWEPDGWAGHERY